jgi:nitrogen regulatory protein PII
MRTGNRGDGKSFILDLPQCIRIRTGGMAPKP